ncbi:MAG: hypothetical protein RRC34_06630 [Lentisphaeria bacterium]|nr:hypothetical protein [Lentisphaeria bacterium]
MSIFKKIKELWSGREMSQEEKEAWRREMVKRKAYILGAGAAYAMRSDEDGVVRIETIKADSEDK